MPREVIHILQFAKMSEVNMIYYEKDYYAIPEAGAEKAYELLRQREGIEPDGNIVWCKPEKKCIVKYMPNTQDALRQPVFKGIRDDA